MSKMKRNVLVVAALTSLAALAGSGGAAASGTPGEALARASAGAHPGESWTQWRRRGVSGGAVAAGVVGGLAAGALIGGLAAQAQPGPGYYGPPGPGVPVGNVYGADPNWVNYCASKYRSFDPVSGTYLARDGYRYPCQ